MKVKVQRSEDARLEYERKNQIRELDDKQNITTQRLSDLNKELTDAQSEAHEKSKRSMNLQVRRPELFPKCAPISFFRTS